MESVDYELNEAIKNAEDDYDREFTKEMINKFPQLNQPTHQIQPIQPKLTNQQIAGKILDVIGQDFEISYLPWEDSIGNVRSIESMDVLYFKQTNKRVLLAESKYQEYVEKIRTLDLPIDSVQITKISYLGKFIEVKLMDVNLRYISKYKAFEEFKSQNQVASQVNRICDYLKASGNTIPREFIEWVEFSGGIERGF